MSMSVLPARVLVECLVRYLSPLKKPFSFCSLVSVVSFDFIHTASLIKHPGLILLFPPATLQPLGPLRVSHLPLYLF